MILQIDIPRTLLLVSDEPDEVMNAWVWMAIQKTALLPEWHVIEREDKSAVAQDKVWFRRIVVKVDEGKPKGRSFLASDLPPYLVRMFCQCHKYEPQILEEIHND